MPPYDALNLHSLAAGLLTATGGLLWAIGGEFGSGENIGAGLSLAGIFYVIRTLLAERHKQRLEIEDRARQMEMARLAGINVRAFLAGTRAIYLWARAARRKHPGLVNALGDLPEFPDLPDFFLDPQAALWGEHEEEVTPWQPPPVTRPTRRPVPEPSPPKSEKSSPAPGPPNEKPLDPDLGQSVYEPSGPNTP